MASAVIVFKIVTSGKLTDWLEPTARNSNLLPVKANGLVRLRSPAWRGNVGRTGVPRPRSRTLALGRLALGRDLLEDVGELVAEEDRDDGRRRFVGAQAVVVGRRRDRGAEQVLVRVDRLDDGGAEEQKERRLSCGVSPGSSRFVPVSVDIEKLTCLPLR